MHKIIGVSALLFLLIVSPVSATTTNPLEAILGESTSLTQLPATVDGPGFIMPHSSFYFVDKLKQKMHLNFAFSIDSKIDIYNKIAGERLAELKIEIEEGNPVGIDTAIAELTSTITLARQDLVKAHQQGRLDTKEAKKLNDIIAQRLAYLSDLESHLSGSLQSKISAAASSLLEDKVKVTAYLPPDIAQGEIDKDMSIVLRTSMNKVTSNASVVEKAVLSKQTKDMSITNKKTSQSTSLQIQKIIEEVKGLANSFNSQENTTSSPPLIIVPSVTQTK